MKKILITGATGQIGSELTLALRNKYGTENIIIAGHKKSPSNELVGGSFYCNFDVRNAKVLNKIIETHQVDSIFHLASLLSAVAEHKPQLAWDINMNGLLNILEAARQFNCSVFFPSSIGAFGSDTPAENTPQDTIQHPNTIYGISKVSGELLCNYYHQRYGVNTRGLRYPGLVSYKTLAGGGTTDYAVDIFYAALSEQHYLCFLKEDTRLDMMYMPDAVNAAINLMEADDARLLHRNGFNVTAMSFSPQMLAAEIKKHIPDFTIDYDVDPVRQAIADSWPRHMDDRAAREEWGWRPEFGLEMMVKDMLAKLVVKLHLF
ncbi:MAG: NAD-dependent epimerase/dehydratase family protein [Methylococcaceae bacterium]|nr:NAD-dependent epimerase/dehydratase family protein [Methylococcaceae bacterium]